MSAGTLNLNIEQGTTFTQTLLWQDGSNTPIDLTGYSARMQIRPTVSSAAVIIELDSPSTGITLTPGTGTGAGQILLSMTAAQTAALSFTTAVYDLEMVSAGGIVTRLVQGTVTLSPEVTR